MLIRGNYGTTDTDEWKPLNFEDSYVAGHAWQRAMMVLDNDPFVRMLGTDNIRSILNAVFSEEGLGIGRLHTTDQDETEDELVRIFYEMPTQSMFSDRFIKRMIDHILFAIFSGSAK